MPRLSRARLIGVDSFEEVVQLHVIQRRLCEGLNGTAGGVSGVETDRVCASESEGMGDRDEGRP